MRNVLEATKDQRRYRARLRNLETHYSAPNIVNAPDVQFSRTETERPGGYLNSAISATAAG